MKSSNSEQDS